MTYSDWNSRHSCPVRTHQHVGVYGWRKRCLYALVLALLAIVIVNFALTLWLIKTMEFNLNGIGELWIIPGGVRLSGKAYVLGSMYSSDIRSHFLKPITIQNAYNVTINTRDEFGYTTNSLYIDNNNIYTNATQFNINDLQGKSLFSVNKNEVVIGAERLRVTGVADFKGSVQTPLVQGCDGSELSLESPSRSLHLSGTLKVWIHTKKDLSTSSLNDMRMDTTSGEIQLKSQNLLLTKLKTIDSGQSISKLKTIDHPYFQPTILNRNSSSATQRKIFQVCACQNGRVFIALQDRNCVLENNSKDCL